MTSLLLSSLPSDLLLRVTEYLSVGDLHNLRLAGIGSRDAALHTHLHATMRDRVIALTALLQRVSGPSFGRRHMSFHRAGSATFFPCWNAVCTSYKPVTLCERDILAAQKRHGQPCRNCHLLPIALTRYSAAVGLLHVSMDSHTDASWFTRVSREFPRVRNLQVAGCPASELPNQMGTHVLLSGLHTFTRLHTLELYGCAIKRLPDAVLRLSGLRNLMLLRMPELSALPDDMGVRLPKLAYLNLYFTGVDFVPLSVLDTLELNFRPNSRPLSISVVRREGTIHSGPVFACLDAQRHPEIYAELNDP